MQACPSTRDNGCGNKMLSPRGPASLRRSEQVDGGLILMEEERRQPTSSWRLPPEVGELMQKP